MLCRRILPVFLLLACFLSVQSEARSAPATTDSSAQPPAIPDTLPIAPAAPASARGSTPATLPSVPAPSSQPSAHSRVAAVTVYQGTALVTREVDVPAGAGLVEVVVRPLPPQTVDSSLYTEGAEGMRVLSTRYRTRAVLEDTREEVRVKAEQIKTLQLQNEKLQRDMEVVASNLQFLTKLESFTGATLAQLSEKGLLNAEGTVKLSTFVMDTRAEKSKQQVDLQQSIQQNTNAIAFAQRQLSELAAGTSHTEREAVIVIDKAGPGAGSVKLNYLVSEATWMPQYKLRAGNEKDPVQVEYLAAIQQQSGEDWTGVDLVLSTAQPMLNAAPPELLALDISVLRPGAPAQQAQQLSKLETYRAAKDLRQRAQSELNQNAEAQAGGTLNEAAASEQWADLLAKEDLDNAGGAPATRDGPSVAYHLATKLTIPSRNDQQLVEVARIELQPSYFYKAVPVLTPHVYRLATLANESKYVLLPGEATMYLGSDFVGRMNLPLVAIGEQFTVGFGVDPQIQVTRQLVDKGHSIQGGNQVQTYNYVIRVNSFKASAAQLQVWDRLPRAANESVAVELGKSTPDLSADPAYQRADRPQNLLRWDLSVKPGTSGEKASNIAYEFKIQYDRNVAISNFKPSSHK